MAHQAFFSPPTAPGNLARIKISPSNGALYTASSDARVYKQLVTAGDFVSLGFSLGYYFDVIGIAPNGNLYSYYSGTSDVVQLFEGGTYSILYHNFGGNCKGVTVAPNYDIYACYESGLSPIGIVYNPGGVGAWTVLDTTLGWTGIAASAAGDIYASKGTSIYKQTGGVGAFSIWYTAAFTIGSVAISSIDDLYFFNAASTNKYYKRAGITGAVEELTAPSSSIWLSAEERVDGTFYLSGAAGIRCFVPGITFSTIYFSPSESNTWPFNTMAKAATNPTSLLYDYSRRGTIIDPTDTIYVVDAVVEAPAAAPSLNINGATLRGYNGDKTDSLALVNGVVSGSGTILDLVITAGSSGTIQANVIDNCDFTLTGAKSLTASLTGTNITASLVSGTLTVGTGLDITASFNGGKVVGGTIRDCYFSTIKRTNNFVYVYTELSSTKVFMTDVVSSGGSYSIVYADFYDNNSKFFNNLIIADTREASYMDVYVYLDMYDENKSYFIENNTIINKDGMYIEAYGDHDLGLRWSNNIVVSPRDPGYIDVWFDYPGNVFNFSHLNNLFQSVDVLYYARDGVEILPDVSEIFGDPLFLGSGPEPYRLQLGSPARHSGYHYPDSPIEDIVGTPRPDPPSMGAYEDEITGDDRYWIASSDSTFNSTDNWAYSSGGSPGASVPGPSNVVFFDSEGLGSCLIDATMDIKGLYVEPTYSGVIYQQQYPIIVDGSDASFAGGSFSGSSAPITLLNSLYIGSFANFVSTSGTMTLYGNFQFNPSSTDGTAEAVLTEDFTLQSTNLTTKSIILSRYPIDAKNVAVSVVGGVPQDYDVDYYIIGNILKWDGKELDGYLEIGDILRITYAPDPNISGEFIHNYGTFKAMNDSSVLFRPSGAYFYDLIIDGSGGSRIIDTSSFVEHQLTLANGYLTCGVDGTINVTGDVCCSHDYGMWSNDANVQIRMTVGYAQNLLTSGGVLPHLYVDKTSSRQVKVFGDGPLYIDGDFYVIDGTFNTNGVNVQVGAI